MRVTVDPLELMTMAVTLGTSAVELADVGTSLHACVDCAMPPDIRNMLDQIVATSDTVLDSSASVLRTEAADLARRSLIATNDSLAAASLAAAPAAMAVIGGNNASTITFTNVSPATPMDDWDSFKARGNMIAIPGNNDWNLFKWRYPPTGGRRNPGLVAESENSALTLAMIRKMGQAPDPTSHLLKPTEGQVRNQEQLNSPTKVNELKPLIEKKYGRDDRP